jgi:tetratricopeptide (TPR) repeat protein
MPDDSYAWSTFGWLCYKTRRIDEGIETLLDVIGERGADGNLYVSLGNLYTAAFNYAEARRYYTLAIAYAKKKNSRIWRRYTTTIDRFSKRRFIGLKARTKIAPRRLGQCLDPPRT